jgi:hypothetical protein
MGKASTNWGRRAKLLLELTFHTACTIATIPTSLIIGKSIACGDFKCASVGHIIQSIFAIAILLPYLAFVIRLAGTDGMLLHFGFNAWSWKDDNTGAVTVDVGLFANRSAPYKRMMVVWNVAFAITTAILSTANQNQTLSGFHLFFLATYFVISFYFRPYYKRSIQGLHMFAVLCITVISVSIALGNWYPSDADSSVSAMNITNITATTTIPVANNSTNNLTNPFLNSTMLQEETTFQTYAVSIVFPLLTLGG